MLTERMCGILKKLNSTSNSYTNSNELANMLGVSSRTIKRDLKEIIEILKDNGADVEATNQGYKISVKDEEIYSYFIEENLNVGLDVTNKKQSKVKGIIELLLSNKYINQDKIADELYISRSSINKVMIDVKNTLSECGISLQNKPHYGYILEGEEIKIRNYMVRYLTEMKDDNSIVISKKLKFFSESSYDAILEDIKLIFKKLKILKNDIEIGYLTRYIIISAFRVKNDFDIKLDENIQLSLDNSIVSASKSISNKVKEHFDLDFSFEENIYISYVIGNHYGEVEEVRKKDEINLDQMVIYAIDKIKDEYDIDFFRDDTLIKGLVSHLYTSYSRYYLNVTLDNPMIDLIKTEYIEAYNYSILFSNIFRDKYNINMTEEDIGYIALHFAASLERDIMNNNIKVIIVCSSGVGTAELLKTRIVKKFPNIKIQGVYPAYILDSLDTMDIDFVISTVNIKDFRLDKEIVNISPLLVNEDIEKINEHIKRQRDFDYLQSLMSEDLFFTSIDANSKEQVIEIMCKDMIDEKIISPKTKDGILQREEMSSTEINELVAIPHYITQDNRNSVIAIGILKRPIVWDKTQVQVVFLGVLDPKVKKNRKVFTMLYKLTQNIGIVKELVEIDNLSYFKKKLFK